MIIPPTRLSSLACAFGAALLTLSSTQAATSVLVSGTGAAGDASLTINTPVTFEISAGFTDLIFFVMDGSNPNSPTQVALPVSGDLTYRINGGAERPIERWTAGGYIGGVFTADDSYFYGLTTETVTAGSTITLSGTSVAATAADPGFVDPESGQYDIVIGGNLGELRSSPGISIAAVPEPSSSALLGLAGFALILRRKRA